MLDGLLANRMKSITIRGDKVSVEQNLDNKVVIAGSFNPVHQGHQSIVNTAQQMFGAGKEIVYELGINNPDKGGLDKQEILRRIGIFIKKGWTIRISQKCLLFDISDDYEDSLICVGYDTIVRVFMEKYYENGLEDIYRGFEGIQANGNRLVVFGRQSGQQGFKQFGQFLESDEGEVMGQVYQRYRDRFILVGESGFRMDISSSEIRNKTKKNTI